MGFIRLDDGSLKAEALGSGNYELLQLEALRPHQVGCLNFWEAANPEVLGGGDLGHGGHKHSWENTRFPLVMMLCKGT